MIDTSAFACNECKRRKAKCSREVPVCSACQKSGRHCQYVRYKSTPLTRRHLTEVENRLRVAEAIIRQSLPHVDLEAENVDRRSRELSVQDPPDLNKQQPNDPIDLDLADLSADPVSAMSVSDPGATSGKDLEIPVGTNGDGSHYEWDERCASGPDHMTLTNLDTPSGYLGVASNAAMLHFIRALMVQDEATDQEPVLEHPTGFKVRLSAEHLSRNAMHALYMSKVTATGPTIFANARVPGPISRQMPQRLGHRDPLAPESLTRYLQGYFDTIHPMYPFLYQAEFMQKFKLGLEKGFDDKPKPNNSYFQALVLIVAALGAYMSATSDTDDDVVLYQAARSQLSLDVLEIGTLELVQCLALMSKYLMKRDRPNSGYNYLGVAERTAIGLGLHKELPEGQGTPFEREVRRRVWWCLYVFDSEATIAYSRPITLSWFGIETHMPLNVHERDVNRYTPPHLVRETDEPTLYSYLSFAARFHVQTNYLYNRLIARPYPTVHQALRWDDRYIRAYARSLPANFQDMGGPNEMCQRFLRSVLLLRARHLEIILLRPFLVKRALSSSDLLPPGFSNNSVNADMNLAASLCDSDATNMATYRCLDAAESTLKDLHDYMNRLKSKPTRHTGTYVVHFAFPSILVIVFVIRAGKGSSVRKQLVEALQRALDILELVVPSAPGALHCIRFIHAMTDEFVNPTVDQPAVVERPRLDQMSSLYSKLWPPGDESVVLSEVPELSFTQYSQADFDALLDSLNVGF